MYPVPNDSDTESDGKWWLDGAGKPRRGVAPQDNFLLAKEPVYSHIYSPDELSALCERRSIVPPRTFKQITLAVKQLSKQLVQDKDSEVRHPWVHNAERPYSDQALVHVCCALDRSRELSVDNRYTTKRWYCLVVLSYDLDTKSLAAFVKAQGRKKDPVSTPMKFRVYREWFNQYLAWFDPALLDFVRAGVDGTAVLRLPKRLGADDEPSYEQQGILVRDRRLVPLPKTHAVVSTENSFGLLTEDEKEPFADYCLDPYDSARVGRGYNEELTATCNPKGFQYIPIARSCYRIPPHLMQVRAIRAEVRSRGSTQIVRWIGLQGNKYVSLPTPWVEQNFELSLRNEALERGTSLPNNEARRFVRIPPGDARDDDPPVQLRSTSGKNFYYQGKTDNCLMGGSVNAVFIMGGRDMAEDLLNSFIPLKVGCWDEFVKKVSMAIPTHCLKKIHCPDVLLWDDSFPLVVHLRSKDDSESHAICIYRGCIYDSASRFVLTKSKESLSWSSGLWGFKSHLRLYQLKPHAHLLPSTESNPKKKKRRH